MPGAMVCPQSVTVDTVVYIAVRYSVSVSGDILRYDLHSQQWMEPLQYPYWACGMTTVSSQLVMVGGNDVSTAPYKTTNRVAVYSPSQRRWSQPYPPLKTPRWLPAVSTYHQRLVVAGGHDDSDTNLASVEVLDISVRHCQWLSATGLPVSCHLMSAAITDGALYLLGGSLGKKVLSVSLSALTETDKPPAQWCTLPNTPLKNSTAIAVCGSLLAVGGSHGGQRSSAIHVYDQEKNAWSKVGDLPTERQDCAYCLLPSGEILVAGGQDHNGKCTVARWGHLRSVTSADSQIAGCAVQIPKLLSALCRFPNCCLRCADSRIAVCAVQIPELLSALCRFPNCRFHCGSRHETAYRKLCKSYQTHAQRNCNLKFARFLELKL